MSHPNLPNRPNMIETEVEIAAIAREVRTIAVVGMKDESEPSAPAFEIPQALQKRGIRIIPVNPKLTAALGEHAYPDLASISEHIDLVQIFRRSEAVGPIADAILALPAKRRPAAVWMQSGIRNDEAALKLAQAGIRVVQDRCLSVYASRYRR